MAVRADSGTPTASVWQLITEPTPGRLAFAARLALICTLVAVFAEFYTTPEIALTVYVVFFLNKPDRTSSMLLTVAITILITVVIALLFVLAQPVLGNPGLRVLTMALISFVMMFLASASKLKPVASVVALVIAYALDVLSSAPLGEAGTRALLYAWLFVGIPALISAVVNSLIAPSPRSMVQKEIAERLRSARLHDSLDGTAAVETAAASTRSRESKSLAALETVLHVRIAALQQAVSNMKQVEQDG